MALLLQPLPLLYKCRVLLLMASFLGIGTAQFQACYDNATVNCGGNVVTGVSTARECCLGNGYWFRDLNLGGCVQCIVHGFERSMVSVNEGGTQETLVIHLDIKGNTLDEPALFQVTRINFTVVCQDVTTESDDYSSSTCDSQSVTRLNLNDPEMMDSEVHITFQADNHAMEGTEELRLGLRLEQDTQNAVTASRKVFFQSTSIKIRDTTVLRPTFSLAVYEGTEGPDRRSSLDPAPCCVHVRLEGTIIEEDLTIRLIPRTFSENVAVNGPPPAAERLGSNASRMDFNDTQPFEVIIPARTTVIRADIPIVDDDINEGAEEFVVVLEVASVTTNPVDFTGRTQTTVCRIPASDPIEIGFRQPLLQQNEEERIFTAIIGKDRPSDLTYVVDVVVSTPNTADGQAATPNVDFTFGYLAARVRILPSQDHVELLYSIFEDNIPENTELIQISSSSNESLCDADPRFRFNGHDCFRDLQIQILDDDVVVVGFVGTLVEVNESDGRATLNVSISHPAPNPLLPFRIVFTLLANTVDGLAGSRPTSAACRDPRPGIEDYQQIVNTTLYFSDAQRLQTFDVMIFEDAVPEDVEELNVTIILDPTTSIGIVGERVSVTPAVATVRIRDNDSITVGYVETDVSVFESVGVAQLTVAISAPVTIETSFFLLVNTNDGTATASAPNDYGALTGFSLGPFNNSVRQLSFNLSIVNDVILEENEDFTASLTVSPADRTRLGNRVTVQPNVATVTVLDNDGVGLTLNGMTLANNSIVAITDIGSGAAALVCTTTYTPCCFSGNREAQWYFPNGSQVPNNPSLPYQRTRGTNPGRVFLHRNSEDTTTGIFRCDIPVASDATQSLYVRIYTPEFQCYDNAAANCGGNVVIGVSIAQDCCLGNGYWFRDPNLGGCVQCIVHGFERSMVSVNEGDRQTTLVIRLDIKGNTLDEPPPFQVTRINFTVVCQDVTTESDDYSSTSCDYQTVTQLNRRDPGPMNSEVRINFQADNCAMEGTEELQLGFQLTRNTQNAVTTSGNIFFQKTSIQITDTTALRPTFSLAVYEGTEGPDRRSSLDPAPCHVLVRLVGTIIEEDLAIRLIPRTFSENVALNGPHPTAERQGFNASRMDFNDTQPFEVTIPAGTTAIRADIPIVDDDINEGAEEFVVVAEVASVTTNPVDFTGRTQIQTTVCRIPASDPIEIGFTQAIVRHNEEERTFTAFLEKDRPSELEYVVDIVVSTPNTGYGRAATPNVDFTFGLLVGGSFPVRVPPTLDRILINYQIFEDNIPENTELIQLSLSSNEVPTFLCDADPMFRFNGRDCFRDLLIQILDDDE